MNILVPLTILFFGVTVNVDCTRAYREAKNKGVSFSLFAPASYHHGCRQSRRVPLSYRRRKVVCYDSLLPEATVGRADHTFSFASFEYDPDELTFILKAKAEMERLQTTTGLNKEGTFHPNAIHYSAVPWLTFTDMKHPTNMRSGDSVPKISTGKYFREGEKLMLPISVTCHHGLMDGYHVAKFIESLDL